MADGQVVFEISGDNRNVKQALNDTTNAIESESKKWDKAADDSAKTMEQKLTAAFKAITASALAMKAGKALLDFGKDALQAASDLEEVQNVVDTTFGDSAGQIEKWAKAAGTQFGLTETQAKKFTSTLGAMMKSAGLAGPEIVNMSTDLAGLAADMASFYNLDFEEAFQKIRSGISGETEPLKQLGINMSVANLEAYALTQGITKAFDQMTQGEQTLLRYQYMMQATADAQGDFARTSDGYANSVRQLQTNIDSLKTSIGTVIIPIVSEVVQGINDMIGALTQKKPRTVLDDFADIDLKTNEKLAEIQKTADEANALIAVLEEIGGKQITSTSLTNFVGTLTDKLTGLDGAMEKAKTGDYKGTISELAKALELNTNVDAGKWSTLLTAISEKLPAVVEATKDKSADEQVAAFLEAAGTAASSLGGEYPALWGQFLGILGTDAGAAITALANGATAGAALEGLANGANALKTSVDVSKWESLLDALSGTGSLNVGNVGKSVEDLANALNGNDPETDRAQAWQTLIQALSSNLEALSGLTGEGAEGTRRWLEELAAGANSLDPSKAEGWDELFTRLVEGLPGLKDTEYGGLFKSLLGQTDDAERNLRALGYETDDIADKQSAWLEVCRRLVQTIPGLNSIINTETGEVEGGTEAIKQYVKEWQQAQEKFTMLQAVQDRKNALDQKFTELPGLRIDAAVARKHAQDAADAMKEAYGIAFDELGNELNAEELNPANIDMKAWKRDLANYRELVAAALEAEGELARQQGDYEAAKKALEEQQQIVEAMPGDVEALTGAIDAASDSMSELEKAANGDEEALTGVTAAIESTTKALEEVQKYYDNVHDSTRKSIESVVSGFNAIETPADQARNKMADLTKQINELNAAGKDSSGVQETFNSIADSIPSIQNMTQALDDQLKYLQEYQKFLDEARARGVSEDILAMLSDGSTESYDYLKALATGTGDIEALNKRYGEVAAAKKELTDSLTQTQLNADEEFQGLVTAAQKAAAGLDVYSDAKGAMERTVQGIADGIEAKVSAVQAQVDALNAALSNIGAGLGGFLGSAFSYVPKLAIGMDYVPFDNYLAQLHEGESVLTAEEAKVWRAFKNGGSAVANTIDYDAMGGVMRDNIKPGGNVYLDGRIVGEVISTRQGNSLRQLERSGWQK